MSALVAMNSENPPAPLCYQQRGRDRRTGTSRNRGGAEKEEHEREMRLSSLEEEEDNVKD
jgi:hypothetical protein